MDCHPQASSTGSGLHFPPLWILQDRLGFLPVSLEGNRKNNKRYLMMIGGLNHKSSLFSFIGPTLSMWMPKANHDLCHSLLMLWWGLAFQDMLERLTHFHMVMWYVLCQWATQLNMFILVEKAASKFGTLVNQGARLLSRSLIAFKETITFGPLSFYQMAGL